MVQAEPAPQAEDYRPTVGLFLRALGLVYLIVFASVAVQARVLIGRDGLLPVGDFLALHQGDGLSNLVRRLCTQPASVRQLFRPEAFLETPPMAIRIAYYRYQMTDLETRDRAGIYWTRELLGYSPQVYVCDSPGPPRLRG